MPFSGYQDLDPAFATALQAMIAANAGISPFSGYRSPERQAQLYDAAIKKYGSPERARKWVAPPGRSRHNAGRAVDLRYTDDAARAWAHANAAQYGLAFPMAHEPWHVELVGSRGGGKQQQQAKAPRSISGIGSPTEQPAQDDPSMNFLQQLMMARYGRDQLPQRPMGFGESLMRGQNPIRAMVYQQLGKLFA